MKALAVLLVLTLVTPAAALGAEPLARTFTAPVDRVWTVTEGILKILGWDIDKADRTIGFITTESRQVEGENYGVYEKGTRHRLRLQVKAAGDNRTTVTVERFLFKRERILFVDKDEPLTTTDRSVERAVLDAIARAL
ncbi:MAG: hypothetical protein AUH29_07335 [Candidatus Rokubacteria bacterium 13_1_40CM_69_27]|nr:MAG: hypothetical protein AUH29_07335 [Candidatus Rokubacteria bacterium 13_1_40CM_69_27]OLC39791.1 MAG: hypothetical protein AUH81_00105 [Candidatus Rokubacteria bacterium 13_1_40CM_4_69_5]